MPIIHIELIEGRTDMQKSELAARMTRAMEEVCGVAAADIHIVFSDVSKADWFVAGSAVGGRSLKSRS